MVKISLKQLVYLAESKTNGSLFIVLIKVILYRAGVVYLPVPLQYRNL